MPNFRLKELAFLGWNAALEDHWIHYSQIDHVPARIVGEEKGLFRVQLGPETQWWGEVSGKFRFNSPEWPATGDWVTVTPRPGDERVTIHEVLPRRSCLQRLAAGTHERHQVLATNVDTAFIVSSLNRDLNPRRIERYLAMIWESGATPVVLLTKSDLVDDPSESIALIGMTAMGVEVIAVSALDGTGLDRLSPYLGEGKTVVLLGSSGAGKSTLANRLLGEELLATQEVREDDDRGRHTTTSRYLFALPGGGLLIDTPGMRELKIDGEGGVDTAFDDIVYLTKQCRFDDCQHRTEPNCAILAAIENGQLEEERYASYCKLLREVRFQETKHDKAVQSANRKEWKMINKNLRKFYRSNR